MGVPLACWVARLDCLRLTVGGSDASKWTPLRERDPHPPPTKRWKLTNSEGQGLESLVDGR
jgi:hypothetical protein